MGNGISPAGPHLLASGHRDLVLEDGVPALEEECAKNAMQRNHSHSPTFVACALGFVASRLDSATKIRDEAGLRSIGNQPALAIEHLPFRAGDTLAAMK